MFLLKLCKKILGSATLWVLLINLFVDFQILQYFLYMLILWGNYNFIQTMLKNKKCEKYEKELIIIGNAIVHIILPITLIIIKKVYKYPLTFNNYLLGIVIGGLIILFMDTNYCYSKSKIQLVLESFLFWTIIFIFSNIFIKNK